MEYSGPLSTHSAPLGDAATQALAGDAVAAAGDVLLEQLARPIGPLSAVDREATRLFPEHFWIMGLMLVSFASAASALLR